MFEMKLTYLDVLNLASGAWVTISLTIIAMLIGTVLGMLFGVLRAHAPLLTAPIGAILDVFRSTPLLVQFILFNSANSIVGLNFGIFTVAYLVLGMYAAALCTEVARGGILAVSRDLRVASRSLGMTWLQDLLYIVFPIAARISFPSWINIMLQVMKDTSAVLVIGLVELLRATQQVNVRINEPILLFFLAGVFYFVISLAVAELGRRVEDRWGHDDRDN